MTREEAIKLLKTAYPKCCKEVNYRLQGGFDNHESPLGQALDMAIKALEQEPVIDKIRAEIEQEIIPRNSGQYDHEAKWQNCGLRIALKVIDEYKPESEEEE